MKTIQTTNIHNFANRLLCEYASIFPTVASLLDHLLFTIGNGYDFDEDVGMIIDTEGQRIDEYPTMTDADWNELISLCHNKEHKWETKFNQQFNRPVNEERLAENCKKYKIVNVDDTMFTEESLYADLVKTQRLMSQDMFTMDRYLRPYPLSEKYSAIYELNKNTPKWFLRIAYDFCKAWVRFLNEQLAADNIEKTDKSDYADLTWTTRHRDMLEVLIEEMNEGLEND